MKDEPLVSVIVPTFNSEKFWEKCLASVKDQTYPIIEVIVVDNHSNDRTREIAGRSGARVVLCRAGRSRARNVGADYAKGELVLFVDSDMELDSCVVSECIRRIKEGSDAVIIPEISVGEGFWAKCKALEKACYVGDDSLEAARLFRKSVFEIVLGYDPRLEAGEDWDLSQKVIKAGYRIGRIGAFIKHNEGQLNLQSTIQKKHYYGKTLDLYWLKHPIEAKRQLRLVRPAFLRNWRRLARDPSHAIGLMILKMFEFCAGGIGYLENKVAKSDE